MQVTVGGDAGLVYSPPTLNANVGDMVEFTFMSMNHTVTQSTFPLPCVKMQGGVDSGFMPNPNNTVSPPPSMMFQVTTTDPICKTVRSRGKSPSF
jgi:plastocyanin